MKKYLTVLVPYPRLAHNSYFISSTDSYRDVNGDTVIVTFVSFATHDKKQIQRILRDGVREIDKFYQAKSCNYVGGDLSNLAIKKNLLRLIELIYQEAEVDCPQEVARHIFERYGGMSISDVYCFNECIFTL